VAAHAGYGWYLRYCAWRSTLTGVTPGLIPFFWGVSKTV
jgi:peptide/nickel transport system substrate-binding protein